MRYRVDRSVRRLDGGRTLLGGAPLRWFRLSDAGRRWFEDLADGADQPLPASDRTGGAGTQTGDPVAALLRRLLDAGVVHPVVVPDDTTRAPSDAAPPGDRPSCSIVVPVRDRPDELADLLDSLQRCDAADGVLDEVVVVDDGSEDGPAHAAVAAAAGARLLRLDQSLGPAGARSAGVRAARNEAVVVIDSDVQVTPGWLGPLLGHLRDLDVAAVGARVRSASGPGRISAYESTGSPLDLGPDPAVVAPGGRVAYVPSAALLLRRSAWLEVGGFDESLRFGEDVDLEWRLHAAGWTVRHEPASLVTHRPRRTLGAWLRQRFEYGTSAAALDERHPGLVPPWRASRWSLAVWVLAATGLPVPAVGVAAVSAGLALRRLDGLPAVEVVRLVLRGHWGAGRSLARAAVRTWWPLVLAAAIVSRRARRAAVAAVVWTAADRWWCEGSVRSAGEIPLGLLDDVAYGAGVWWGCRARRRWGPLVPALDP